MYIHHGPEYAINAYYQHGPAQFVGDLPTYLFKDQPRSGLNLKVILKMTFRRSLMSIILTGIRYTDFIYQVIQIIGPAGYTNEFIEITPCPLFNEFARNASVLSVESLAVERAGITQYANEYAQMYIGVIYKIKFIVARWGKAFYAFPCADK